MLAVGHLKHSQCKCMVFVEEPVKFSKELCPQECVENEMVEFVCEVTKLTPVTWYRDGKPIEEGKDYEITSSGLVHKLTIHKTKLVDEVDFSVSAGPAKSTAPLTVEGKCNYL